MRRKMIMEKETHGGKITTKSIMKIMKKTGRNKEISFGNQKEETGGEEYRIEDEEV